MDAGARDAAASEPHDAAGADATSGDTGPLMSMPDADHDGGAPICDQAECPFSDVVLRWPSMNPSLITHDTAQRPCCIGAGHEGECGVLFPDSYDVEWGARCEPLVQGTPDETCLDTVVDGELIRGCRRPDGKCGHSTPGWGCHEVLRYYWNFGSDADPSIPNPFVCVTQDGRCSHDWECCAHPNYGGACEEDFYDDEDGGAPRGRCESNDIVLP